VSTAFSRTDPQDERGQLILAGAYRRISRDRENNQLAVQRQERDLEELAEYLGVRIIEWYTDNDISGDGTKRRSGYMDMVESLRSGRVGMVLATEVARYQRGHTEYMQFYQVCENRKAKVAWKGGLADFGQTETLMQMEMWALMAREELRTMKRRVQRKHRELEARGMPNGGGRAFGFERDMRTLRPPYSYSRLSDRRLITVDEPEIIREMARRVLDGEYLHALARELNERGVLPVRSARWAPCQLRQFLLSGRISGRREVFGTTDEGKKNTHGRIVGEGKWTAIITPKQSDALRRLIRDPARKALGSKQLSKHVLAGLLTCGLCGSKMYSRGHGTMRCSECAKVSILVAPIEEMVIEDVIMRVDSGALTAALRNDDDAEVARELAEVEDQQKHLAAVWAAGQLPSEAWQVANEGLAVRHLALTNRLAETARSQGLADLPSPLRGAWATLSLAQQRAVIRLLVDRIVIAPSTGRRRDLGRCTVIPKQ
jgi:site-specific DNA recombinase